MTRIYLETQKEQTSEYCFIKSIINNCLEIDDSQFEIVPVNGKDNLRNVATKLIETSLEGGRNVIIFDADNPAKGGGFVARKEFIETFLHTGDIDAEVFLFPNNQDDGDFETLLLRIVQRDKHALFFDCYEDYEKCLGEEYEHPNLKGKIFTYVSAQKMTGPQRKKLGQGDWMFDNPEIWDLGSSNLQPLIEFLQKIFV